MPIDLFFFPFLLPSYCHSVVHHVVSIVSDGCNQSSFMFFYIVFESSYRYVYAVFNTGKSSSSLSLSFLDTYSLSTFPRGCNTLCIVISFLVLWSICLRSSRVHFWWGPEYLTWGTAQVFIPLIRFRQHWSLSDSKSSQVSRTLRSIQADFNNIIVWMISTRPLISKPLCPFNKPSVTVPKTSIIIGINVTFMFHSFSIPLARSRYLSFFSFSFHFTLWSTGTAKTTVLQVLFFCFCLLL